LPGDSPEELKLLLQGQLRPESPAPPHLWIDSTNVKVDTKVTIILLYCDMLLQNLNKFIMKGISTFPDKRFLKLVGDFTHQQTKGGLKKGVLGFAGVHYHKNQWTSTILPVMFTICHEETEEVLKTAVKSLKEVVKNMFDIELGTFVSDWFWDGRTEVENVFNADFAGARVTCVCNTAHQGTSFWWLQIRLFNAH